MTKALPALLALFCACAAPAMAQDRVTLGFGRLFSNDRLGDARDRWRSGSYTVSMVRGTDWRGQAPARFGDIVEYRVRAEIVAPQNLSRPARGDRRYAGMLSIGMHSHAAMAGFETRLGLDLVGTGSATGVGRFQSWVHGILDLPKPALGNQIPNRIHPTLSAEVGRSLSLGGAQLRPFVEAQTGIETYLRAGADVTIGRIGTGALMLRDPTTGQRYTGIRGRAEPGFSLTFGGDVARVTDSALLPAGGPAPLRTRDRLRLGLHWQGDKSEVFYGIARLGREFEGQPGGQMVGSIRARIRF
ncbi:MAG: lipid A-modifier LpxR family protein [Gemmobacter sp.]